MLENSMVLPTIAPIEDYLTDDQQLCIDRTLEAEARQALEGQGEARIDLLDFLSERGDDFRAAILAAKTGNRDFAIGCLLDVFRDFQFGYVDAIDNRMHVERELGLA